MTGYDRLEVALGRNVPPDGYACPRPRPTRCLPRERRVGRGLGCAWLLLIAQAAVVPDATIILRQKSWYRGSRKYYVFRDLECLVACPLCTIVTPGHLHEPEPRVTNRHTRRKAGPHTGGAPRQVYGASRDDGCVTEWLSHGVRRWNVQYVKGNAGT